MKTALLIDGGHLRAACKRADVQYNNDLIVDFANRCFAENEHIYRIFYFDARPFSGKLRTPVSGTDVEYQNRSMWLDTLATKKRFAVRLGRVAFRGWKLKREKHENLPKKDLTDNHFRPAFEQKGVDMRIGLDIANLASRGRIDRILLVSGDSDMEPALKEGRIAGLEVVVILITGTNLHPHKSLLAHSDEIREVPLSTALVASDPVTTAEERT